MSDRRFAFLGASHIKALAHLLYGIQQPGALLHLTGDTGSGKTTVCRLLLDRLPQDIDAALILDPSLLAESLDHHLRAWHDHNRRTVLIIDDAQRLGVASLDQFRAPPEFLQLILSGRSELIDFLGHQALHRLSHAASAGYHLLPLAEAETSAYIRHRLTLAGGARDIFERASLPEVHRLSGGTPQLINTICDRALLDAYARRRTTVDVAAVRAAAHQEFVETFESVAPEPPKAPPKRRPLWPWLAIAGLVATALVLGAIVLIVRSPGHLLVEPRGPAEGDHYPAPSPPGDAAPPVQAPSSSPGVADPPEQTGAPGPEPAQGDAGDEEAR